VSAWGACLITERVNMQTETQSQKIVADIVRKHHNDEADACLQAFCAFVLALCALALTIILFSI